MKIVSRPSTSLPSSMPWVGVFDARSLSPLACLHDCPSRHENESLLLREALSIISRVSLRNLAKVQNKPSKFSYARKWAFHLSRSGVLLALLADVSESSSNIQFFSSALSAALKQHLPVSPPSDPGLPKGISALPPERVQEIAEDFCAGFAAEKAKAFQAFEAERKSQPKKSPTSKGLSVKFGPKELGTLAFVFGILLIGLISLQFFARVQAKDSPLSTRPPSLDKASALFEFSDTRIQPDASRDKEKRSPLRPETLRLRERKLN